MARRSLIKVGSFMRHYCWFLEILILFTLSPQTIQNRVDAQSEIEGVIAFLSGSSGHNNIYVMNADGSEARNLTHVATNEEKLVWSPDGQKLVFERNVTPDERYGKWDLFVVALDGTTTRLTSHHGVAAPVWLPDGKHIAYTLDFSSFNSQIAVISADGSDEHLLLKGTEAGSYPNDGAVWSPDGQHVVYQSKRHGDYNLFLADSDGKQERQITHSSSFKDQISWSPDGTRIAFTTLDERRTGPEIFVMNADGANLTQLTDNQAIDTQINWSPDSRRMAFTSTRDGNGEIYVMNADGSNPVNVSQSPALDSLPTWAPHGQKIAFSSDRDGNLEIYVVAVDGSDLTNITNDPGDQWHPVWQPAEK